MADAKHLPPKDPGPLRFTTELRDAGRGGSYVEFPYDVEESFGTRGRVAVRVTVNGAPYRGSLVKYRGVHMVGITKAVRQAAGAEVGDLVEIVLSVDTEERSVDVPADLAAALAADVRAAVGWDRFSYTHQREYVEAVVEAKREETRAKRVAAAVEAARAKAGDQGP